jgi:hypothetical protein
MARLRESTGLGALFSLLLFISLARNCFSRYCAQVASPWSAPTFSDSLARIRTCHFVLNNAALLHFFLSFSSFLTHGGAAPPSFYVAIKALTNF